MKVLVTGGSGFIGWYVCRALADRGDEIVILDLIDPGSDWPAHTFVKGDVRHAPAVQKAIAGCDAVIHLAAAHHDFGIEEKTYYDVNETGTQVICDVMDEYGVKQICFYSTVAVYGDAPEPLTEETTPQPNTPYGGSKLAGEKVLQAWTERGDDRRALVIRPTVTFGVRNFANMYSLIRQIHSGKFFRVGAGSNIKSLSYVENIVAATLYLWSRDDLPPFEVVAYIDKPDLTSWQISETVYDALQKNAPRWRVPMWAARTAALPFDAVIAVTGKNIPVSGARIKKLFSTQTKFEADQLAHYGFEAPTPLRDGIRKMVRWYLDGGKDENAEWHQPPAQVVTTVS